MKYLRSHWQRFVHSAVVWSWGLNGLRLASGLLLLPLLLRLFPESDLGLYYVLLSLTALVPIIDFGFSVSIGRYVSYAMAGATELQAVGYIPNQEGTQPNLRLLWRILSGTRRLFGCLALIAAVLLGTAGGFAIALRVHETSSPLYSWLAFAVTVVAAVLEIYAGWWNIFLRGMNHVLLSTRISVLAYLLRFVLAIVLLLTGAGLLAVPIAGLISSFLQRHLSRRACLSYLGPPPAEAGQRAPALLPVLWPNSWRIGLQFSSSYLASYGNTFICLAVFGLAANAQYGLSMQVTLIIQGMAMVWTAVKWPLVGQHRTREDYPALRQLLWGRVWLQSATFVVLSAGVLLFGDEILRWLKTEKVLLPVPWLGLLLLNSFLEMQMCFWTTLLSTENRVPSLWPTVITNGLSLLTALFLVHFTNLGFGALVLPPLVGGCLFNYWFWAKAGAESLKTGWFRFTFCPPH